MKRRIGLLLLLLAWVPVGATSPEDVVGRVNGEKITRGMLDRMVEGTLASMDRQGVGVAGEDLMAVRRLVLEQIVDNILLGQAGREAGITASAEEVEAELVSFRGPAGSEEALKERLAEVGMSLEELRRHLERDLVAAKYLDSLLAEECKPKEEQIQAYYRAHREDFVRPEARRVRHVLIPADRASSPEEVAEARQKAEEVRRRALAGEDLSELARKHSACPSSKEGGDLGFIVRGETDPAFEAAAWALEPGQISEVVRSRYGFHVMVLLEHRPAREVSLDEAEDGIRAKLFEQAYRQGMVEILKALRKKAKIEH